MPADLSSRIQPLLDRLTDRGPEIGLQLAVYQHGKLRINAVSGSTDRATNISVTPDTLFPIFSVTKGIASTVIHRLVERGILHYETPIAHYWPEFAAHGKDGITLRDVLSHAAGLPQMPNGLRLEDMADWNFMCAQIANLSPLWPPGSRIEYHPITFGWLMGEPAVRATGRSFSQLMQEEIYGPLGGADLYIGLPKDIDRAIAVLAEDPTVFPKPVIPPKGTPEPIPARFGCLSSLMNLPSSQAACSPGTSGLFTAMASARHYAALLDHSLLSREQFRQASAPQQPRQPSGDFPLDRALGYQLGVSPTGSVTVGHGGHGGSTAFGDPTHGIAIGLHKNWLTDGEPSQSIITEIYRLLSD